MIKVIGVSFKDDNRLHYFNPKNLLIKKGYNLIVETEKGTRFGVSKTDIIDIDEKKIKSPLKNVIRIATRKDEQLHKKNLEDAGRALIKCRELVKKNKLNMQLIDASYTFDRDQLIFHFLSDNRVDFRNLAKQLASIYRTRIELRQVGVRDKAKEIGGIGHCGRAICCSKFLKEFDTVSIGMAKNQNVSLNPNKINGVCGRLLCCLKYEDENYSDCRKCLPQIGQQVETEKGKGTVTNIDILKKTYTVTIPQVGDIEISKGCHED